MKRTQLYIDDELWSVLEIQAKQAGTSVSELVRLAIRERYAASPETRRRAMLNWAGVWRGRKDMADSETYLRRLRKGKRLRRLET